MPRKSAPRATHGAKKGAKMGGRKGVKKGGRRGRPVNQSNDSDALAKAVDVMPTEGNLADLFTRPTYTVAAHIDTQTRARQKYMATMLVLNKNGVDLLQGQKVRALVSAWARKDHGLATALLSSDNFGVVEVAKAVALLDARRRATTAEKRLEQLVKAQATAGDKGKSRLGRKIVEQKKIVNNLKRDVPPMGSASGALSKHIRAWTRSLNASELEFYALHLPPETWTQLADICHLNPEKDFPQLPWFLRACYDRKAAPEDSLIRKCAGITKENASEYIALYDIPYAFIKSLDAKLTVDAKKRVATYTKQLDTLLWDYEQLACPEVDAIIESRLKAGETCKLPYGKLMERLLMLRKQRASDGKTVPFYELLLPNAEEMLKQIDLPLESPVVVIGDASASMDVAIQTSTIVASFITALTNAKLVFFSDGYFEPQFTPKTASDVIELAIVTKTKCSTCHAAALKPFYVEKSVVKTFVICTDEEENTSVSIDGRNYRFQELYKKYHDEVYPARLVFVSFLRGQHCPGQMVQPLTAAGYPVTQFKLDSSRPDLSKLNNLIGQLATDSADFDTEVSRMEEKLICEGALEKGGDKLAGVIEQMQV